MSRGRWALIVVFAGITMLVALPAQGIDFHHPSRSSGTLEGFHKLIREQAPRLDKDRSLKPDIERVAAMIESGRFYEAVSGALPSG